MSGGYEHKIMSVDEMRASGALVVDIRTPPEWYQTGVIEGARLIPFHDPNAFVREIEGDIADGRDVVLVCRSGSRTQAAGMYLSRMIPNKVISAAGGMIEIVARQGYQPVAPE
ncbi:rhodanese-like domain-containing protein [Maritimibacter fusiformis]|uniref:Rhodanese-like domain-containing protein n=1 Tax=Maritimibacter fusiformis TaxID=2603819 RepID=A0A5D0RLS6_9RHOB|nr:rhodanese-like domain-containing protein [Maritimibacter fusiformis]TYB82403.1 rhodanese-like domain-containing protein [Maritimibacter fusiformis]